MGKGKGSESKRARYWAKFKIKKIAIIQKALEKAGGKAKEILAERLRYWESK